jgi:serine/threonine protein kinase
LEHMLAEQNSSETEGLAVGAKLLNGQFLIQARLQSGGFGIAYVAQDSLARQVVVKECFPEDLCLREGALVSPASPHVADKFHAIKAQFIREARQLAKLVHPSIVAVHQVFEENNTAYMALDQVQGADFVTICEEQPERITNDFLQTTLRQCLTAIGFIHGNHLLHRDISPDNIMVNSGDQVTLIDFGACKEHSDPAHTTLFAVKDGFSPYEFYTPKGAHDFASDFYALGATFHYLIVGSPPPDSYSRLKALIAGQKDPYRPLVESDWPIDYNLLVTIDRALKMRQKNRYQTAAEWLEDLDGQPKKHPLPPAMVRFDPNLENDIARIVQITNTQMTQLNSDADYGHDNQGGAPSRQAAQPKIFFDIYGNPIKNLDRWQQDQEREIRSREGGSRTNGRGASGPLNDANSAKQPLLKWLVSRCLPKSTKTTATPTNP